MKKVQKALALGLCLTLGASIFVACGGNNDDNKDTKPKAVPYFLAGYIRGTHAWDDATETNRFSKTDDANVYEITLDMWKDDYFKIRYEGKTWDAFQANYDNSFDETQKADPATKIIDGANVNNPGDNYPDEHNFGVGANGNYTIRINVGGDKPVVTYVWNKDSADKRPNPVQDIYLNKKGIGMELGTASATFQIEATLDPEDGDEKDDIIYESDDETIATVSETGLVTAVKKGKTTISVQCGAASAELNVTVVNNGEAILAEKLELDKSKVTLVPGTPVTLEATITPDGVTDDTVTWTSSDTTVVKVDEEGKLVAVKPGKATVTASTGTGENEKKAECEVTVPAGWYLVGDFNKDLGGETWKNYAEDLSGISGKIVFTAANAAGDKFTLKAAFNRGDQIKILPLGDKTWDKAVKFDNLVDENSKFISAGGNIKFLDSAEYTLTLEQVDDTSEDAEEGAKKWQLSYTIDQDIADTTYESYTVEVWGSGVPNWANAYEGKTTTVNAAGNWKAEITLTLAEGEAFQFRYKIGESTVYIKAGEGTNGENGNAELFGNSGDYTVQEGKAGTYKFTLTFNEYGECETVAVVAA